MNDPANWTSADIAEHTRAMKMADAFANFNLPEAPQAIETALANFYASDASDDLMAHARIIAAIQKEITG